MLEWNFLGGWYWGRRKIAKLSKTSGERQKKAVEKKKLVKGLSEKITTLEDSNHLFFKKALLSDANDYAMRNEINTQQAESLQITLI